MDASRSDGTMGCVLGLALGDALGAPFEFRRSHDVPSPVPALELPWRGGPAGSTTDDTAMALSLVASLTERGAFDGEDLLARHVTWLATDPPDVGTLTRRVLQRVARGERDAARTVWEDRGPEVSAGNGSVMYCAPLGAAYADRPEELFELAPALSALTHWDERCRTACLAVTLTVAALVRGEPPDTSLTSAIGAIQDRPGGEELEFLVEAVDATRPIDGPDQGFCLFTAAAGLQALARGGPFDSELLRVVGLGGDTDTNAAVAGALLGARDGASELPRAWLSKLQGLERLQVAGDALAARFSCPEGRL
jgi:ADP-ribosyl-[dinitrogen reductase] hydrolase